jgi:hypothetical protein
VRLLSSEKSTTRLLQTITNSSDTLTLTAEAIARQKLTGVLVGFIKPKDIGITVQVIEPPYDGLPSAVIGGIIVGGLAVFVIIIMIIVCFKRRIAARKKNAEHGRGKQYIRKKIIKKMTFHTLPV